MGDREHMVQMLCRQILNMREPDGSDPRVSPGAESVGSAQVNVEMRGMVMNMRRQIWIDSAAWTEKVVAEIERQAAEVNLDAEIAKVVRAEVQHVLANIENIAAQKVKALVDAALEQRLKDLPNRIASKMAGRLWSEMYSDIKKERP